jgi:hypothetical protein
MPIVRWICLLSVALAVSANLALAGAAQGAELPVKTNPATQEPRQSGRLCTDMEGKKFRWNWPNVPFATKMRRTPSQRRNRGALRNNAGHEWRSRH